MSDPNKTEFPAGGDYALFTFLLQHSAETRWEFVGLKKGKAAVCVFASSSNDYSKSGVSKLLLQGARYKYLRLWGPCGLCHAAIVA